MISQALRLHQTTVTRHLNDYREGKLTIASGGSESLLNDEQTMRLIAHLSTHTYQTTHGIIAYVKARYGVSYSVPGMNKWLHRHGFSYKKPKGHPYKACPEQQEAFKAHYESLKAALAEDEAILFMDACHPSMGTKISHGWIKKGITKSIETNASRTRVNIVGAIDLSRLESSVVCTYSTVDSESIVDFLAQMREVSPVSGTLHLILDQAGYHRSEEVSNAAKRLNIQLHFLPPYSPNLNPIERLWKLMNEKVRNNRFFSSAAEFQQCIANFFSDSLPQLASSLHLRINDNFQSLNYAI